jgi:hypothetical protein
MKVLIIQEKSEIRDYLQFALGVFDQVDLKATGSVAQSIDYLHYNDDVNCIFIGNKITQDSDPKELLTKILAYCSANDSILIGTNKGLENYSGGHYIHPQASVNIINRVIRSKLGLDTSVLDLENFIPVSFELCAEITSLPCDLHLKIGQKEHTKHLKRYLKGSRIDKESLEEYLDKNLINVYVQKEDYKIFESFFGLNISNQYVSPRILPTEIQNSYFDSLKDSIDYGAFIIETSGMVGFDTSKTHLLAKKLQTQVRNLSDNKKVKIEEMFHLSLASKGNIDLKINSLCSIISTNLVKQYSWGTLEMVETLMFASAFHNIGLSGNAKLITIITDDEYDKLDIKERAVIDHHAAYSSSIVGALDFIHPNVKKLIVEQHGIPNGESFIDKNNNSSNFTAMFRIVSELSTQLVKEFEVNTDKFSALKVIEREKERNNNDYPEIYDALIACIP